MSSHIPDDRRSSADQILDLLLDALLERNAARRAQSGAHVPPAASTAPAQAELTGVPPESAEPAASRPPAQPEPAAAAAYPAPPPPGRPRVSSAPRPGDEGWQVPPPLPGLNLGRTLGRLAILVAVLAVVINIPINRYGVSLAQLMPDTASIVIRDGLVLKGSGTEIYILQDNKLRWITSLDAFDHMGLTWADVHVVEDKFLAQFEKGAPIHLLLKCDTSPHIYALENDQKRWIKDIATFSAQGYKWEDVKSVSCSYLRSLPDGLPIPEDAGTPPQP